MWFVELTLGTYVDEISAATRFGSRLSGSPVGGTGGPADAYSAPSDVTVDFASRRFSRGCLLVIAES